MKQSSPDIKRLHLLIERYFDASATEAEEAELRIGLADPSLTSPEIEEARAVTGYFAVVRKQQRNSRVLTAGWTRAAAAVVIAAICATVLFISRQDRDSSLSTDRCVAYIGGTEITDTHRIMEIMRSELGDFGDASVDIRDDIDDQLSIFASELSL